MLQFSDFFTACAGLWKTERIYHHLGTGEIERSYTEFQVNPLTEGEKQQILTVVATSEKGANSPDHCPGFSIAFNTVSETGEQVSMELGALFVPDSLGLIAPETMEVRLPTASEVSEDSEIICGYYLRNQGYSEGGAIAGRFTYQPTRQTLEMTTFYRKSVAVDQMRFISPTTRLRTIVTYRRPESLEIPTEMTLIGFGVEHRSEA